MGRGLRRGALALLALAALSAPPDSRALDLSGFLEAKSTSFLQSRTSLEPSEEGAARFYLKAEGVSDDVVYAASIAAEDSTSRPFEPEMDLVGRGQRPPTVELEEFWLRTQLASEVDLKIGRFLLGWGKTDGYSPADSFLPRDLTDPFADEKLPLLGVLLSGQQDWLRWEALWVPLATPWRLPRLGSRYLPVETGGLPLLEKESPPPHRGFGAVRLLGTFGDWDVGGWVRTGLRPAPLLSIRPDPASPNPFMPTLLAERRYVSESGAGLEVSRLLGAFIARVEGAYLSSPDGEVGESFLWSASVERGWGDGTLIATVAGDDYEGGALLFDRAFLPVFIAAWNQAAGWGSWKLAVSAGLEKGDGLIKGECGYDISDNWKTVLGAEYPYGTASGPFGALKDARRAHLSLRYSW